MSENMKWKRLSERTGVLMMTQANVGVYFLTPTEVILIDTGHIHESKDLLKYIDHMAWQIVYIINTHGHIDHVGGNFLLQEVLGCPIAMPYIDHLYCEDISRYYMSFSTTVVAELTAFGNGTFEVETLLKQQKALTIRGETFEVVALPGHTTNQKGIITPDGYCFLGDGLMGYDTLKTAKFAVVQNLEKHMETLQAISNLPYMTYIIGHGERLFLKTELEALCEANRHYFEAKCDVIRALLTPSKTFDALMQTLAVEYGLRRNLFKYFVAERSIKAMLSYLESRGEVTIHIVDGMLTYTKRD